MRRFLSTYSQRLVILLSLISIVLTQLPLSLYAGGGEADDNEKRILIISSTGISPAVLVPDDERSVISKGEEEDLDENHPLRKLPPELLYKMILPYLDVKAAKNFYLAIAGWKNTLIRDSALDFTLESDFSLLVDKHPDYRRVKTRKKWEAARKLPFGSLEQERCRRGILVRLSFFKPRDTFSYPWFHEQVLSQIVTSDPEQEAKKDLIALYADRLFMGDPANIARPYDSIQDIVAVVAQLMQTRREAIPLICQLFAILREGKTSVTASWFENFTSKSAPVLRTLLETMRTYHFSGFGYFPWRALPIIPEDFDPKILPSLKEKIGISEDTVLRAFPLSREEVQKRIDLICSLAARTVSLGIEDECVSLLKERAFCVRIFEDTEPMMTVVINNWETLLSPLMLDFLRETYGIYSHFTWYKLDEKLAGTICFLFEKTPEEIRSIGRQCEMEWERRLLLRSLKAEVCVALSFVPILIIVHHWISIFMLVAL